MKNTATTNSTTAANYILAVKKILLSAKYPSISFTGNGSGLKSVKGCRWLGSLLSPFKVNKLNLIAATAYFQNSTAAKLKYTASRQAQLNFYNGND